MVYSTNVTYSTSAVKTPLVVANILSDEDLNDTGNSGAIYVGGSIHLLLIVTLGVEVGTGKATFAIQPVNAAGTQIGAFSYATSELVAASVTGLAVDEASATPIGDYVKVVWTGTLDVNNHFTHSSVKLIAK